MLKFKEVKVVFREIPDEITLSINITNCPIKCKDCHSKHLWENIGSDLTITKLNHLITKNEGITCICFMGHGTLKDISYIISIAKSIKKEKNLKIGLYSGYTGLTKLKKCKIFDYIKEGSFDNSKGSLDNYTTNQKFFKLVNNTFVDCTYLFWNNWKYIKGYDYLIFNDGKVYSLISHTFLKPFKNQKGYLKVKLYKDNIPSTKFIHRLVAEAFLSTYDDNLQVNHKDENKINNSVDNLEMCDSTYNNNYGDRTFKSASTHKLGNKRKKVAQYNMNGELINIFNSAASAGRSINKNANLIRHCCKGGVFSKTKNKYYNINYAYGYKWSYI